MKILTKFLFIINNQLRKFIIEVYKLYTYDCSTRTEPIRSFFSFSFCVLLSRFLRNMKICPLSVTNWTLDSLLNSFIYIFPTFARLRGSDETGITMMSRVGFHKSANKIFRITKKPLSIKSSELLRWHITKRWLFLNMFCNPKVDW